MTDNKEKDKENQPVSKQDKQEFIKYLKQTISDMGWAGRQVLKPLISLIKKNYNKIPPKRREFIKKEFQDLQKQSDKGLKYIKDFLKQMTSQIKKTINDFQKNMEKMNNQEDNKSKDQKQDQQK